VGEQLVSVGQQVGQPYLGAWRGTTDPQRMRDVVELLRELIIDTLSLFERLGE